MTDFEKANRCLVAKDYARAVQLFLRHAEKHPEEAARAYAGAAKGCLLSNLLQAPVPAASGVALVFQGDRKNAEHYFRLALRADPTNIESLWGLSQLVPESSTERRDLLERCVELQAGTLNLVALGDYYRSQMGDLERAYAVYKQAQAHAPRDHTAYLRLNDICRRMGRPDEAKEWSRRWQDAKSLKRRVEGKG
jgi:tetratricopeptide (TPR) repeat protein